jgi:hypothetical protein
MLKESKMSLLKKIGLGAAFGAAAGIPLPIIGPIAGAVIGAAGAVALDYGQKQEKKGKGPGKKF